MNQPLAKNLIRFGLVGGLNTGLMYLLFKGLLALHVHYLLAGAICWVVGVSINFVLHRAFTFQLTHKADLREAASFVATYLLQLVVGQVTYWLMIGQMRISPDIAFVCNLLVTTAISFTIMRWVVFRHRPAAVEGAGGV